MRDFTYHVPTEVVFGQSAEGKLTELVQKYGGHKLMIVYGGGSVVRSGLLGRVEDALTKAGVGYCLFGGVQPNPSLEYAREGVQKAIAEAVDMLLAVGGGSSIDTAKAIAHGAASPETDIWAYFAQEKQVCKSLPVGVVLTLPATGSETSDSAVLTNKATGEKRGLGTQFNRPRFAILNPAYAATLPAFQVGCGVVDIMMHTMDRYFNANWDNETSDELAEALLRVVIRNGRLVLEDAANYHAMSEIMWCGSLSHNDLTGAGGNRDFSPHKLGHELSGKFNVAHGASLSAIWCHWATRVCRHTPERFARFAKNVWGLASTGDAMEDGLAGIEATRAYFKSLHMPTNFTELGIGLQSDEVLDDLARRCSLNKTFSIGPLYPMDYEEIRATYADANQ